MSVPLILTKMCCELMETWQMTRNPEGLIVYEANANPADHKVKGESAMAGSRLGM